MDSTKQSLGQKVREKLLKKIEQAKAGDPSHTSSTRGISIQAASEPGGHNLSRESPREITTVGPRLKPFFPRPTTPIQPNSSSPTFIDVDAYIPSFASPEFLSSSSKRKGDFSSSLVTKKGKVLGNPSDAQALTFEQLQEHLSQSERSREQLQAEVRDLQKYLQDREKRYFAIGQRTSSLSERVGKLEKALKASSDRMLRMQVAFAEEARQLALS